MAMGFGLGMFFMVVVVAGGCRGDLGFCFYLGFGIYYFIVYKYYFNVLYCKIKVGMLEYCKIVLYN